MRRSTRIVVTCMALVVCLMAGYVFLTMAGLTERMSADAEMGSAFLSAEECFPLTTRGGIAVICASFALTALAWVLTAEKPRLDLAALMLLLPAGVMIALCKPSFGWYTWDEETHYTLMQAVVGIEGASATDRVMAMSLWDLGYLPSILGMALSRLLGLGDVLEYKLGVLLSAVTYAVLCALAVKHAPKYKMTFLAVSAAPVALFQAASCTYDAMVIASILLAVALLLETWLQPGRLSGPRALTMVTLLTLGTMSKPAYSLLLLLLLLLPQEKLGTAGRAWLWRGFILAMTIWALGSLLMPGTYDNVKGGDERFAGADSAAQWQFILHDPGKALGIIGGYIRDNWIGLHRDDLAHWAYLGNDAALDRCLAIGMLALCPLCVCAGEADRSPLTARRRVVMVALETVVLLVLLVTQYMVSAPVGGDFPAGAMQPRYSMPVWVLLALGLMLPEGLRRAVKPAGRALTGVMTVALAVITFAYAEGKLFGVIGGMG